MDNKKTIYIAHPIGGDVSNNIKKVLKICSEIHNETTIPVVPYLVCLQYLSDTDPASRSLGISADLETFHRGYIDEVWIYGDHISAGMKKEIELALSLNIPVFAKTKETIEEFEKM